MSNLSKSLGKNPFLISQSDLNSVTDTNLIGTDNFKKIFETTRFSFSSVLLNYIEPEIINGVEKTVFYSEINTELEKGDKVFILNGNYDSDIYIDQNKYESNSDGYEVLDVDRCRIVLDIKYNGNKPYIENSDDIIDVYYVSTIDELGSIVSTFSNDIVYYEGELNQLFYDLKSGLTYSSPTVSGFIELNGSTYSNINTDFDNGSGSFTNKKIKIINYNLLYNDKEYKRDFVYKYDSIKGWILSIENLIPIITKSNFRGGKIDGGSWNSGVYGRSDKVLEWTGLNNSKWGGGFLYNSDWKGGVLDSLDTNVSSFVCRLKNGIPVQESIESNNNGYGYNYILNSDIEKGTINNGNIIKTNFTNSLGTNIVKEYIKEGAIPSNDIVVNGGLFLNSDISDSVLSGSKLVNTKLKNSLLKNGISVNSQINSSVFNNSVYVTDEVINVLEISTKDYSNKIEYTFKISETSINRLRLGDSFYIKGIIDSIDNSVLSFFHKKFKLSNWIEKFEYINNINQVAIKEIRSTAFIEDLSIKIIFEKDSTISFPIIDTTDTKNIFILDSNYESGLFESSDWNSGFNINNGGSISKSDGNGEYGLIIQNSDELKIQNSLVRVNKDEVIFLNSVEHVDSLERKTMLDDSYISIDEYGKLKEISSNVLSGLTSSTYTFKTGDGLNRNGYIHRLKFKDSKINSGVFKRTYFNNCLIQNKFYKSTDRDLLDIRNIRSLFINESIFYKTNNTLSSATYVNCLFEDKQDIVVDGIVHNSIWNGGVFNKGVFRESTWIDGEFNGGEFYKNNTFNGSTTDEKPLLTDNRINSFYKSGTMPNNRYSWQNGKFNGGSFIKSDWEDGDFNDGSFIESKFYYGNINGGVLGKKSLDYTRTRIYNGIINNTRVENAHLFTEDYEHTGLESRSILWNNGVFEKGVFGSRNIVKESYYTEVEGNITRSENIDFIYTSNSNNIYRIDIDDQNLNQINIQQTKGTETGTSIKIISDSYGNMFDIKSNKITKYSKNGGVFELRNGTNWEINYTGSIVKDALVDESDNLYVCLSNRIDKYDSNKRLIWSINNNSSNSSIGYDGEFIYVGGWNGYVEKWSKDGDYKWRLSLDYDSILPYTYPQKIIIYENYIFISGVKKISNYSINNRIFRIDKVSLDNTILYDKNIEYSIFSDYIYVYESNEIIITTPTGFDIFNIDDITNIQTKLYTDLSISEQCRGLEYYNGYIYIITRIISNNNPTNTIYKTDTNLSIIKTFTGPSLNPKLHISSNGIRYSRLELISPTDSNGFLVRGDNNFTLQSSSNHDLDMDNIGFKVKKISFNYSISLDSTTTSIDPLPSIPEIQIYKNVNELIYSGTMSIPYKQITRDNGDVVYIYATDWIYFSYDIDSDNVLDQYFLRFNEVDQFTIKIDDLKLHSDSIEMKATWKNGTFNGGEFVEDGVWEDGVFNNGLFLSTKGNDIISSTQSPTQSSQFGWINGKFNGGEFGNGEIENNSLWYNGEFNGGVFKGKLWNNGVFTNGEFIGDIDVNITKKTDSSKAYLTSIFNEDNNIDLTSTKGIWRDGYVSTEKDKHIKDKKIFTDLKKTRKDDTKVVFENVVWSGGTFSHESGSMLNSIWLDGTFESGLFENSVFNPWRPNNTFNENDTCLWKNGIFKGGYFYYSKWKGGLFNTGNAYGMIWEDGISNYMNAYNILWKKGVWKNGNWFGSNFKYDVNIINDIFRTTILNRIDKERHYWNLMDNSNLSSEEISSGTASSNIQ